MVFFVLGNYKAKRLPNTSIKICEHDFTKYKSSMCYKFNIAQVSNLFVKFTFAAMPDNILLLILIFVASLALLVFAAHKFIEAAQKLGLALEIPPFIIGVTVVALGTSLPELVSSIFAVLHGQSELVVGNIVGSNITNILLILGLVAFIGKSFLIKFDFKKVNLPFLVGTAFFLLYAIWDLSIDFWEGLVFVVLSFLYVFISLREGKDLQDEEPPKLTTDIFIWLVLGGIGIYFAADYNISSIIKIGEHFNVNPAIISLTALSFGTSLPELFVCLAAVKKGQGEIAVGNILGSNIYNIIAIGGLSRMVGAVHVAGDHEDAANRQVVVGDVGQPERLGLGVETAQEGEDRCTGAL